MLKFDKEDMLYLLREKGFKAVSMDTPKGIVNVLVAGKTISTDRRVQDSTRVMPVCLAMGEAAGLAAALSAASDGDVHAIDISQLQKRLREHGAYLPE